VVKHISVFWFLFYENQTRETEEQYMYIQLLASKQIYIDAAVASVNMVSLSKTDITWLGIFYIFLFI
jgi:hypothetical protein